jgi:hypothetical protein
MLENTPRKIKGAYNSGEAVAHHGRQTAISIYKPNLELDLPNHTTRQGHD